MLDIAANALFDALSAAAGRPIVYRRGATALQLTAIPGVTEFQVVDDQQFVEEVRSRDFLIHACELQINGTSFRPTRGDTIQEVFPDQTETFEVMSPARGQQPWRYSDSARTLVRVYTKQTS